MFSGSQNPYHLKTKNMKDRKITLSLDTAKEWYNKGGELKEVALQAYSEDELKPMALVRSWEDAFNGGDGSAYIDTTSMIIVEKGTNSLDVYSNRKANKCVFHTAAHAKSAVAFAQLSHIVADANERFVGAHDGCWHQVQQDRCHLQVLSGYGESIGLVMKTHEMAKECINTHRELWNKYFMINTPKK